jgi:hypothetical protein
MEVVLTLNFVMCEEENVDMGTGITICISEVEQQYQSEAGKLTCSGPGSQASVDVVR